MIRLILPKIALVLLLASSLTLDAQINTEKYRKYFSEQKGFMFNMSVGFSGKAGNTEYTAYSGTGRVDYNSKKYATFVVGNFEFKNTAAEKIENNGFMHWRGIKHITPRLNWEVFYQKQYDEFIDLKSRDLVGTGVKYTFIEYVSKNDSTTIFDVNLNTGIMYEEEEYTPDNDVIEKYLLRSTSFISLDWVIKKKLNLTGVVLRK